MRNIDDRLKIRKFKMEIVLPLVNLQPHLRSKMIDHLASKEMDIPFSQRKRISRSTIYQWLKEFTECTDINTLLMPKERKDKGTFPSLTQIQKDTLLIWRSSSAYRTVHDLRTELLANEKTCKPCVPSVSVIARFLRESGYSRRQMLRCQGEAKIRLPFEAEYPLQIYQIDTKGKYIQVQDPNDPGKLVEARLIVILDDYSRYVVLAEYVLNENQAAVISIFCRAISMFGIPEILYGDKGSPYVGTQLRDGAKILGCLVKNTPARDAPAKGKVEKVMPNFTDRLESEMKLLGRTFSLEEANQFLQAYLEQEYNIRVHSVTNETPENRFGSLPVKYRRFVSDQILSLVFLPHKTVKVSKDGRIQFRKQYYLVPHLELYDKKVTIRYREDDKSRVFVWYKDQYFNEARLFIPDNDYRRRLELTKEMGVSTTPTPIPERTDTPMYNRLHRLVLAQRQELETVNNELDINGNLKSCRDRRKELKKELDTKTQPIKAIYFKEFTVDAFMFLLSNLFSRQLQATERNLIEIVWHKKGPFTQEMIERAVGELLGKNHPTTDLKKYLEKIESISEE